MPAKTIYWLISESAKLPTMTDAEIANMLAQVTTHLVVPLSGVPRPAQNMPKDKAEKLLDHFTEVDGKSLSDDELFDLCWSRYLDPTRPLGFHLNDITSLTEETGRRQQLHTPV